MTKKLRLLSFILVLTLAPLLVTYAMKPEEDHKTVTKKAAPAPKRFELYTYLRKALDLDQPILDAIYFHTPELHPDHPNHYVYKRFLTGKLVYKPDSNSDEGMIVMRIADLVNALDGEFDLSKCGIAGRYLSINTGYRKGKRPENKNKVEIWFMPHFISEKNLQGSASHFKDIMGSWDALTAPVGTFFTWGRWDDLNDYDYVTTLNWNSYNDVENNLRNIWVNTSRIHSNNKLTHLHIPIPYPTHQFFMSFLN